MELTGFSCYFILQGHRLHQEHQHGLSARDDEEQAEHGDVDNGDDNDAGTTKKGSSLSLSDDEDNYVVDDDDSYVHDGDDNYVDDGDGNYVVDAGDNNAGDGLSGGLTSDEVEPQQRPWRTRATKWIRAPPPGTHAASVPNAERAPRKSDDKRRGRRRIRPGQAARTMAKVAAASAAASRPTAASGLSGGCMCDLEEDNSFPMVIVVLALIGLFTVPHMLFEPDCLCTCRKSSSLQQPMQEAVTTQLRLQKRLKSQRMLGLLSGLTMHLRIDMP